MLTPKSANFYSFTLKNAFLPLNLQIFCNFPKKNANLDNFFPKKYNFEKISTSESENYGEVFHNFFADQGRNNFFWQNIHLCPSPPIMENNKVVFFLKLDHFCALFVKSGISPLKIPKT